MASPDSLEARVERLGVLIEALGDAGEEDAARRLLGRLRGMERILSDERAAGLDIARAKVREIYARLRAIRVRARLDEIAHELRAAQSCGDRSVTFRLLAEAQSIRAAEVDS